jgi:hypothetical protein
MVTELGGVRTGRAGPAGDTTTTTGGKA